MRTRDADLIVKMVDFEKPGVGTNEYMLEDSFLENVINNEYFNRRLENGMIKALLTHQGRDYADNDQSETPYDDLIATHPDLAGVLRDVWVEDHCAFAAIDLFEEKTFPAAAKVKELVKKGTYVGVSMATECEQLPDGNYEIRSLLGCDFTLDNFFIGSGIITIKKNFSNKKKKIFKLNFANKKAIIINNFDKKHNVNKSNKKDKPFVVMCLYNY